MGSQSHAMDVDLYMQKLVLFEVSGLLVFVFCISFIELPAFDRFVVASVTVLRRYSITRLLF